MFAVDLPAEHEAPRLFEGQRAALVGPPAHIMTSIQAINPVVTRESSTNLLVIS